MHTAHAYRSSNSFTGSAFIAQRIWAKMPKIYVFSVEHTRSLRSAVSTFWNLFHFSRFAILDFALDSVPELRAIKYEFIWKLNFLRFSFSERENEMRTHRGTVGNILRTPIVSQARLLNPKRNKWETLTEANENRKEKKNCLANELFSYSVGTDRQSLRCRLKQTNGNWTSTVWFLRKKFFDVDVFIVVVATRHTREFKLIFLFSFSVYESFTLNRF